jgi:hypothetical protein
MTCPAVRLRPTPAIKPTPGQVNCGQYSRTKSGVCVHKLPAGFLYHYRYEGLRLLYMNSGTYYLLPAGWIPQLPLTFILDTSDETSVELY